jgi:glycosyltransferase involved in cell wall biosynthesis
MVKAADALSEAGYDVRVVSTRTVAWADAADVELSKTRRWRWQPIDLRRSTANARYVRSGVRWRASQTVVRSVGVHAAPLAVAVRAFSRSHDELVAALTSARADFVYGGTAGALAAAAEAGRRLDMPFALDLEDFHRGEDDREDSLGNRLAARIEDATLDRAAFLTAGSAAIARAYAEDPRLDPLPIHNTFPLPRREPDAAVSAGPLRLYWFSQGVGPGRGLEDVVRAAGECGIAAQLHLRGRAVAGYLHRLRALAAAVAPKLSIHHEEPGAPDAMVDLCRGYDVGLSPEQPTNANKDLCLGNKVFTYLLAGLPVVLTTTTAQSELAADLREAAFVYTPGDTTSLAKALRRWDEDRTALAAAGRAAWAAARRRWHWEHPSERGTLLDLVAHTLGRFDASRVHTASSGR